MTFEVYDLLEVRDFLIKAGVFTENEFRLFWRWWCDGSDTRTGPFDRALRNVPLGYWGWIDKTDSTPERQAPPPPGACEHELVAHKVLVALEPFLKDDDGLAYMEW